MLGSGITLDSPLGKGHGVIAQDAGRDQVQHRLLAADDQRMARVVSALKAHHSLRVIRQPVYDLALALVAPLGADDHDVFCHFNLPSGIQ